MRKVRIPMSDIAVIYKSHYGFTEAYARWIAEDLSADLLEAGKVRREDLEKYGTIIYGGGLYAGGVNGISLLVKNAELLLGKKLYLFTVGASDPADPENINNIWNGIAKALPPNMLETIRIYHMRGGLRYSKMSMVHRTMMAMLRKVLLNKPEAELRSEDRALLETYGRDVSFLDRAAIAPLVEDIRQGTVCA